MFSKEFFMRYQALLVVLGVILLMTTLPIVHEKLFVGSAWQGVPPAYGDEILYHSQIHEVADGYPGYGNPYLYEHRNDPPLVIFAGNWLAAVPLILGASLFKALIIDYVIWSVILGLVIYWLFREFDVPKWFAAAGTWLVYSLSFDLMYRPTSRQEVYPVFILLYVALARILKAPTQLNTLLLAGATALSFYVFGYLWQTAVITIGFLFLYALYEKNWALLRATIGAGVLGVALGSPVLLYTFWVSHKPFFWESFSRLGLVETHLPMAEVVYSGGWIGVAIIVALVFYFRSKQSREFTAPLLVISFIVISGLGLWLMEGSNLITGKLLETGEHLRRFIAPWLGIALPLCGYLWWQCKASLAPRWRFVASVFLLVLAVGTGYFFYSYVGGFAIRSINPSLWKEEQTFAAPLRWLDTQEKQPVVIWSNMHNNLNGYIPTLSKHYPLYTEASIFTLTSDQELRERYLVASYFDPVSVDYLKTDMIQFSGRDVLYHFPKTVERGIKICKILHFYNRDWDCGTAPTPAQVVGDAVFEAMVQKFSTDIKPNIKTYLQKYHVSYVLKDTRQDAAFMPEKLGATKVYDDGRYQIFKLP